MCLRYYSRSAEAKAALQANWHAMLEGSGWVWFSLNNQALVVEQSFGLQIYRAITVHSVLYKHTSFLLLIIKVSWKCISCSMYLTFLLHSSCMLSEICSTCFKRSDRKKVILLEQWTSKRYFYGNMPSRIASKRSHRYPAHQRKLHTEKSQIYN